uniref:Uncharacterized protein n=1 Tax=viral metagenome TaxID=1070528 RepID=A0A6C0IZA3_9ZZZZ
MGESVQEKKSFRSTISGYRLSPTFSLSFPHSKGSASSVKVISSI